MTIIGRTAAQHTFAIPGRDGTGITLSWAAATDTGHRRKHNEDSLIAEAPVFAVADGMGGHAAGDVASAAVVTRLGEIESTGYIAPGDIDLALAAATADITLAADDDDLGVGTTVTGAALTMQGGDPYWAVFNVGDSRVYQFEGETLAQVTVDHSVVQELVDSGRISADDAEQHPDSNVITRAVGFGAEPVADFWMLPVRAGLRLLICSDGLTKEVGRAELHLHLSRGLDAEGTVAALVRSALGAGGRDNVTAVVVDVLESGSDYEVENTVPRAQR